MSDQLPDDYKHQGPHRGGDTHIDGHCSYEENKPEKPKCEHILTKFHKCDQFNDEDCIYYIHCRLCGFKLVISEAEYKSESFTYTPGPDPSCPKGGTCIAMVTGWGEIIFYPDDKTVNGLKAAEYKCQKCLRPMEVNQ